MEVNIWKNPKRVNNKKIFDIFEFHQISMIDMYIYSRQSKFEINLSTPFQGLELRISSLLSSTSTLPLF